MKLSVSFSPDLAALLEQEIKAGERAVTAAMKSAGAGLKQEWREQIARAGLGHRLPRTIRNRTYPTSGDSINAAAFIWSNAPEILNAHDRGALIRSKFGFWLAIPTEAAGKGRRGARGMGAAARDAIAVYLPPQRAEFVGGGKSADQYARDSGGVAVKDRTWAGHRADLHSGAAGETAKAAGSG